jgi:TPR repeat protein
MAEVSMMYYTGYGVEASPEEGFKWLSLAAMSGNAVAQCDLGAAYFNANGTSKDFTKAVHWFQQSADNGVPEAYYGLGSCYLKDPAHKDYSLAAFNFDKGAQAGDISCMRNLGLMLYEGLGIPRDEKTAFGWFLKAAMQDDPESQFYLCCCYLGGTGVEEDYGRALEWCLKSAKSGYAPAINNLGSLYMTESSDMYDPKKGFELYLEASERGFHIADVNVAKCYEYGLGTDKNLTKAIEWYEKAYSNGIKEARGFADELRKQLD